MIVDGLSHRAIAKLLGVSHATVMNIERQALAKMAAVARREGMLVAEMFDEMASKRDGRATNGREPGKCPGPHARTFPVGFSIPALRCTVAGCFHRSISKRRRMCNKHDTRWRRHGCTEQQRVETATPEGEKR